MLLVVQPWNTSISTNEIKENHVLTIPTIELSSENQKDNLEPEDDKDLHLSYLPQYQTFVLEIDLCRLTWVLFSKRPSSPISCADVPNIYLTIRHAYYCSIAQNKLNSGFRGYVIKNLIYLPALTCFPSPEKK